MHHAAHSGIKRIRPLPNLSRPLWFAKAATAAECGVRLAVWGRRSATCFNTLISS